MTVKDVERQQSELKADDRCDRCSAQAFALAVKTIDGQLLNLMFCGHHFKKAAYKLGFENWSITDKTSNIN
jgi:ribosomal protein S14